MDSRAPGSPPPVRRPPPGVAPPTAPAPPWVRTLEPSEASPAPPGEADEEVYVDDFDEEAETTDGERSPSLDLPMDSPAPAKTVVLRSSASAAPALEQSSSPTGVEASAVGTAASPADSGFNQGLGKLSVIKASVDLYATDSDDEEVNKQRFFSKLEQRWRESHDSQDLDYAALNKLLDKVEAQGQDMAPLQLSVESDTAQNTSRQPEAASAPSPVGRVQESSGSKAENQEAVEDMPSLSLGSLSSKASLRKSVASTPLVSLPTAGKNSGRDQVALSRDQTAAAAAATTATTSPTTAGLPQENDTSQLPNDSKSSARGSVDLSKLKVLKEKQHLRRKAAHSGSTSESLASSVAASEPSSPKGRKGAGGGDTNVLAAQFAELQQQMLTMSTQMGSRASARQSIVQQRNHTNEVALLNQKLEAEGQARQAEASKHSEAMKKAEDNEKYLKEAYEARLREKQKELTEAKLKLQDLESTEPKGKVMDAKATVVTLSEDDLAALRQEIKEQEQLITGYQQENEVAVKQIKEMKVQAKRNEEHLMNEIARLESQLADTKEIGAVTAQEVGTRLKEKLGLETEIAAVKQAAEGRETELRSEIDRLRKEKRELDAKLGGVDINRMADEDKLVKSITEEMQQLQKQHTADMRGMKEKLAWYAENQEMLTANDELIQQQSETISELERRLRHYEGADGKGNANVRKIKELQRQLQQLQEALTSKNPTSLPALIHAARPSLEETEQGKDMLATIDKLRHQLRAKDAEMERKLRALRQDHEKVRSQYEAKKQAAEQKESRADMRRIKEMEKQLSEVRSFYQKKVKNLTEELNSSRKTSDTGSDASARQPPAAGKHDSKQRANHEKSSASSMELQRRNERIADLEAQVVRLQAQRETGNRRADTLAEERQQSEEAAVTSLRRQVTQLLEERTKLQADLAAASGHGGEAAQDQEELQSLRRRVESSEMAIATVQRAHTEAVEKAIRAEATHQKAMQQLHEGHAARVHEVRTQAERAEAVRWEARCANAEKALRCAEAQVEALQQQVEATEAGLPYTPSTAQFRALEAKIAQLEERERTKERRWESVLEETQQIHGMQAAMQRKKWELALEEKNIEIEHFRQELDAILGAANQLAMQQRQQQQQPGTTNLPICAEGQAGRKGQPFQSLDINVIQ